MASKVLRSDIPNLGKPALVGKSNGIKTQRKGGLGGRKPLGDISNSGKPALTQVSKKNPSNEIASDKVQRKGGLGGRKPLGDISNSGKIALTLVSKKKPSKEIASDKVQSHSRKALKPQKKRNTELSVVAEEPLCPESPDCHNHELCIDADIKASELDMDYFLMTQLKKLTSPQEPPVSTNLEPESPLHFIEMSESEEEKSPTSYKRAKSPHCYANSPFILEEICSADCHFELIKTPDFKLMKTA